MNRKNWIYKDRQEWTCSYIEHLFTNTELSDYEYHTQQEIVYYINERYEFVTENLILFLVYNEDNEQSLNYWSRKVYTPLHKSKKWVCTYKPIPRKKLMKLAIEPFKNEIYDKIDTVIGNEMLIQHYTCKKEYNKDIIYKKIIIYFDWLFTQFYYKEKGVTIDMVRDELIYLQKCSENGVDYIWKTLKISNKLLLRD